MWLCYVVGLPCGFVLGYLYLLQKENDERSEFEEEEHERQIEKKKEKAIAEAIDYIAEGDMKNVTYSKDNEYGTYSANGKGRYLPEKTVESYCVMRRAVPIGRFEVHRVHDRVKVDNLRCIAHDKRATGET